MVAKEFGCHTPRRKGCDKWGVIAGSAWWFCCYTPRRRQGVWQQWFKFLLSSGTFVDGASAADAVPGLKTGSSEGALVIDPCAILSVSCALGASAAAVGIGMVCSGKKK